MFEGVSLTSRSAYIEQKSARSVKIFLVKIKFLVFLNFNLLNSFRGVEICFKINHKDSILHIYNCMELIVIPQFLQVKIAAVGRIFHLQFYLFKAFY